MSIEQSEDGALRLCGSLRIEEAGELQAALLEQLATPCQPRLELSLVESCDAPSLQLLYAFARSARALSKPARMTHASPALLEACSSLGLDFASLDSSVADDATPYNSAVEISIPNVEDLDSARED